MTHEEKLALLEVLDALWVCCDRHPFPARKLNELRKALDLPKVNYKRNP